MDYIKKLPGFRLLLTYKKGWLQSDIVAGIVLTTLLVPQGMAYAELAGLPAITGLYTTVLCLVGYAIFGPSRILVLGPDSSLGPLIAATILPIALSNGDPNQAIALASMLAVIVGLIMIFAGVAKLGFIADLLSKPTRIGYMNGLALTILIGQLPKLFGFSTDADGLVNEAKAFVQGVMSGDTIVLALAIGLISIGIIIVLNRWMPKVPGILVAVLIAIGLSSFFGLGDKGVSLVGSLPQGFPPFTIPHVSLADISLLFAGALGIALVALTDTISTASAFAHKSGEQVKGNGEMIGIGAANVAAGFFQGFPVSTSGSRTAVAEQAGAKTQLTGIVGAIFIILMLVFVPSLLSNLPQPTLAAVVIVASISLADIPAMRRLWHQRKSEFMLAFVAFLGVALVGILEGIAIAVLLSVLNIFRRAWWPYMARLGKVTGLAGHHDTKQYPKAKQVPGLIIFRFDAPLFFANCGTFRDRIRKYVINNPDVKWIIIAAEPITDIDTTAADMLLELDAELNKKDKYLVFAELKNSVRKKLVKYELIEPLESKHFFPTISSAVESFKKSNNVDWQEVPKK